MEVLGELAAGGALRWAALPAASSAVRPASGPGLRSVPAGLQPSQALASDGGGSGDLPRILALLKRASSTAVEDTGVMGFRAAVVTRRNHQHRQRHPALQPSPPPDPQGTVADPGPNRGALVHPATPHRPTTGPAKKQLLQTRVTLSCSDGVPKCISLIGKPDAPTLSLRACW